MEEGKKEKWGVALGIDQEERESADFFRKQRRKSSYRAKAVTGFKRGKNETEVADMEREGSGMETQRRGKKAVNLIKGGEINLGRCLLQRFY